MTDFQSRSGQVGRSYEEQVVGWLTDKGFKITGRNIRHASGIQLDIAATDPFGGEVGIECKASDDCAPEQTRGMRRSDNRWKVLGYLWALRVWKARGFTAPRYMLFTSDLPEPGSVQRSLLDMAEALGELTIVHLPFTVKEVNAA
jgi:Holliday junction resolvase-like predicted endonuclease